MPQPLRGLAGTVKVAPVPCQQQSHGSAEQNSCLQKFKAKVSLKQALMTKAICAQAVDKNSQAVPARQIQHIGPVGSRTMLCSGHQTRRSRLQAVSFKDAR